MKYELFTKSYAPDADIYQNTIVVQGASNFSVKHGTANSDVILGICVNPDQDTTPGVDYSAGDRCDVQHFGIGEVKIGGSVTRGDLITSDSSGYGVTLTDAALASGAGWSVGIALESGSANDIISIFVLPQKHSVMDNVTASAAELNLLDNAAYANSTASVAVIMDSLKRIRNVANKGTANTGVTAVEFGDGLHHTTILTVDTTLPAIAGGANLGIGKLLYTLPAGAHIIKSAYMSMAITQGDGNITADTPDVGIGTVIASGVVAVLSGTATFENILTGQTAADCNGTATVKTVADQIKVIESGDAHTIYLNVADGWAASGDDGAGLAGTVVLEWQTMNA